MSAEHETILLQEIHGAIEEAASSLAERLGSRQGFDLIYPPGASLEESELNALANLELSPAARSGLKKVIRDACSHPFFHILCIMDAVLDPTVEHNGEGVGGETWLPLTFCTRDAEASGWTMLHDLFYETAPAE